MQFIVFTGERVVYGRRFFFLFIYFKAFTAEYAGNFLGTGGLAGNDFSQCCAIGIFTAQVSNAQGAEQGEFLHQYIL